MATTLLVEWVLERFEDFVVGVDVNVGFCDDGSESCFAGCEGGGAEFLGFDLCDDGPGVVGLALVVAGDFWVFGGLGFWCDGVFNGDYAFVVDFDGSGYGESPEAEGKHCSDE